MGDSSSDDDDETKVRKSSRANMAVSPSSAALGGKRFERTWENGLYGCCDEGCGTCLYAFCCVPCAISTARYKLKKQTTTDEWIFNCCCVTPAAAYSETRRAYHIGVSDDYFYDMLIGSCCVPCAAARMLIQMRRAPQPGPAKRLNGSWRVYVPSAEMNGGLCTYQDIFWGVLLCSALVKINTCLLHIGGSMAVSRMDPDNIPFCFALLCYPLVSLFSAIK
jgi:hypothetical protein